MERADRIIVGGFAAVIALRLAMWPLLPAGIGSRVAMRRARRHTTVG